MQSSRSTVLGLTHMGSTAVRGARTLHMHPTHEAGTSTTKTQLNSTRVDRGSRTLNKYQTALRNFKGNEREGTNGTLTCHVCICNICGFFFFFCLDYYGFKFLYKIKVTEAEFSVRCGTRVPTRGALWKERLKLVRNLEGEQVLRSIFLKTKL